MSQNSAIKIFLRLRPTKKPLNDYEMNQNKIKFSNIRLKKEEDFINNNRNEYKYTFDKILGFETQQEEVFNIIGKEMVDQALDGINGTVFAYGQSGSGKTYTITGGAEKYKDRGKLYFLLKGLIPRVISYLFEKRSKNLQ